MSTLGERIANQVAKDMREFYDYAVTAQIQHSLGGTGGVKHFEKEAFPARFAKYLEEFVQTDKDSVRCMVEYLQDNGYLAHQQRMTNDLNEQQFRQGWKILCRLYTGRNAHCLKYGCSTKTLTQWANHHRKNSAVHHHSFYRRILAEAVHRGWATVSLNQWGYRKYKFHI